jgi:hypothetical protein
VALGTEDDVQPDLAHHTAAGSRYDAVEGGLAKMEMGLFDAHLLHCVTVQDVDAAAAVYEDSSQVDRVLLREHEARVHDHSISS